ncbi:putative guanine nucleotide exchange factor-like protein [Rosellinia necatrix]|uniref:Guanine nucleotide-exchange factor SEC12 n=1 Tax=Rosellinia necatrix TaxID=77044 RepID=A0A1W2TLX2_ROSNE|nr:putative guanine nucleotide exchange factor-like protein [Rosellinia necatrix]
MVKQLPSASIQLTYPLYCCDFADPDHLVVAGGGGPGRNGVGNKITLLNISDAPQLTEVSELELSPNEDNVMSLVVVGAQKDKPTVTTLLAGVNSSPADVNKGQNKHLRALTITQPGKSAKTGGVKIAELARDALFVHKDKDTYQRILRLSPPHEGLTSSPRLGAAATGLSKHPQIALFDVPSTNSPRWKTRGRLDPRVEAMDLDVIQTGPDTYQLAYCDDHEVFTVEVSKAEVSEPKCVYTIEPDEGEAVKASFKSLRYLTPGFLVTVVNNPQSRGVALHGLRLPKNDDEDARLAIRARLPSTVSKATSIAVRNLSPVASPSDKQEDAQFVIAVAGNDSSISLYTLEHKSAFETEVLCDLAPFQIIKSVHPSSITNLAISTFTPPKGSSKSSSELCVKLASVSVGCSTVVHNIPIKKYVDKSSSTKTGRPPKPSRYIVALKSQAESPATIITLISIMFLILVLVGQVIIEAKGLGEPIIGARKVLPVSWTVPIRKVPRVKESTNDQKTIENLLSDVDARHSQQMVIKHDDLGAIGPDGLPVLQVDIHDEETHGPATAWENLEKKDQDLWKQRLQKSGHWIEDMGESIFKGVLFGEIGGAIGNMVGEAL